MDFQYTVGKFRNFDKSVFCRSRLNVATDGARTKSLDREFQMGATRWAKKCLRAFSLASGILTRSG